MMRLNAIECVKGELFKKDHQLLQFTGLVDKQGEELYELDVIMIERARYCIMWDDQQHGWVLKNISNDSIMPFLRDVTENGVRLWNYLESDAKQP